MSMTWLSCEKDDDDSIDSGIVGTWTCSNHYYGGSDTYIFKKNGSYEWSYRGSANLFDPEKGSYTYNGTILTITNNNGTTWVYVVLGISNSTMTIMDEDGDKFTYYKG